MALNVRVEDKEFYRRNLEKYSNLNHILHPTIYVDITNIGDKESRRADKKIKYVYSVNDHG